MKEPEHKVVTPFISPSEVKARQLKEAALFSEDIHVGPSTQLFGVFQTRGVMIVDGQIEGADILAERLVLSHVGQVAGKALVQRAELSGVFDGDLVASDEVIIRPTAKISGSVRCQKLVIHRGASIECHFSCASEPENADGELGASANFFKMASRSAGKLGSGRERRLLLIGAGSVFALLGLLSLLGGMKMLLV